MRSFVILSLISILLLSACSSLEHQSDLPDKQPLPVIESSLNIVKKWATSAGDGTGGKDLRLSLVIAGKILLTADYRGNITAMNLSSGAKTWSLALEQPVSAGPAVADSRLVVGTHNGKVIAVDIASHKIAWTSITTSEVLAAPRIADELVFVHTMDGGLSALSMLDGRQLWRFTHNLPALVLRKSSTPVVSNEHVIAGFSTGKILALNKNDGAVDWSQDVAHPKGKTDLQRMVDISADPVLQDNIVYAASYQGNLVALQAQSGHLLWDREISSFSGFAIESKIIYVAATNGHVIAIDQKSGATLWVQSALQGRILSKPASSNGYLIIGDDDGVVHWLDKKTGKLVGRYEVDKEGVEATPVIDNNIAYILGRSGKLVALEVK